MSSAMVDMMFMIIMLGGAYWLYSTGKLDELFRNEGDGGGKGGSCTLSPATPYSYTGDSWSSKAWTTARKTVVTDRKKAKENTDKTDKRVCIVAVGDGGYKTNGDGTFDVTGSSPRITVTGNWTNVEETIWIYNTGTIDIDLRPKTDHYCNKKSKFGGYIINFDFVKGMVNVRKEIEHGVEKAYSKRICHNNTSVPKGWVGIRGVVYTIGNNVKVEGYMNTGNGWQKKTEGIDDGSWVGAPHLGACGGSAIRTNEANKTTKYKDWTVREITIGQPKPQPIPKKSAVGYIIPNVGMVPTYYTDSDSLGFSQWEDDEDGRIYPR